MRDEIPEGDALEQAQPVAPAGDDAPSRDPEVPEADALEQAKAVPIDDEEYAP